LCFGLWRYELGLVSYQPLNHFRKVLMLQGKDLCGNGLRTVFGNDGCGCLKNNLPFFLGKNWIPFIAHSAYEKFTPKVKNRRASTFFMGYAFDTITANVLQLFEVKEFEALMFGFEQKYN
jgi:hypothetical protein